MQITVAELAKKLGASFDGDGSLVIHGVAGIREAEPGEVTFIAHPRYAPHLARTRASAVIVGKAWDKPVPAPAVIRADDVEKAFTAAAVLFMPPPVVIRPGIHPTAIVAEGVTLGKDAHVGPYSVLEPGVRVGDRSVISAGCYLGHGVTVGQDSKLYPHVTVREHCRIGDRTIIHNGTVVGSDGFGYAADKQGVRTKIPQIGIVVIGNDVEIGANVTIDRARFGKTRIGNGVKIDNLVQVAHNVIIGDHAVLVAQVGIAGSSIIETKAQLGGQAGITGHVVIHEGALIGAQSGISKDVPPGTFMFGSPAVPMKEFSEYQAHVHRLPELKKRVAELEKRLKELEGGSR